MRKVLLVLISISCSLIAWSDNGRGSKDKLTEAESYALKKPATRAFGEGQSPRPNLARQYAVDDARKSLSEVLEIALLRAAKNIDQDLAKFIGSDDGGENLYETNESKDNLTKVICQNVIKGTPIVKMDRFYNKKNKMYSVVVCVEYIGEPADMAKETVKNLKDRLSDNDKIKIESNLDMLEKGIEKELLDNDSMEKEDEDF